MPADSAASPGGRHLSIHASLAAQLARGPWAITPDGLRAHLSVMHAAQQNARALIAEQGPRLRAREAHRAAGLRLLNATSLDHAAALDAACACLWDSGDEWFEPSADAHIRPRVGDRVIGVLPVRGALMSQASMCWEGYDSLEASGRALVAMGVDDLVMRIGSPGGACQGLSEFCRGIRGWKDAGVVVHAVVDFEACSAAYAIAAQADVIYVSDSSLTGHGGTWSDWYDVTDMLRKEGIRHGYIEEPAGGVKTFFAGDNTEITAEEQGRKRDAVMRPIVQHFFAKFMADIEAGRGDRISARDAAGLLAMVYPGTSPSGDGKTVLEVGLADEVATFEELITALEGGTLVPAMEVE